MKVFIRTSILRLVKRQAQALYPYNLIQSYLKMRQKSNKWLITFTLTIDYESQTFIPKYTHKLLDSQPSRHQCNCAYLGNIHPAADLDDLHRGFYPSRTHKARFLFTSDTKLKNAKKLCLTQPSGKHDNKDVFRVWILSLVAQLSEFCESDHSRDRFDAMRDFKLRPFKTKNISPSQTCKGVAIMLQNPLNINEVKGHGMGYVYVLRDQMGVSTLGELKIGFSKYHPEHRAHELARCLARPEVISHTPLLPHAKRLELIIHTELQAVRKILPCPKCEHSHQEWFTISHSQSREVVSRWGRWILQRPYVDGKLVDEWKSYLSTLKVDSVKEDKDVPQFWQDSIDSFHIGGTKGTESQRIGKYLNDCYWHNIYELYGLDQYETARWDKFRKDMTINRNGKGYTSEDLLHYIARRDEQSRTDPELERYKLFDKENDPIERLVPALRSKLAQEGQISWDCRISDIINIETPLGRNFHPETKIRHILSPDNSPGILLRLMVSGRDTLWAPREKTLLQRMDEIKAIKTGAVSVSDNFLGKTESPLGDATMMPILALKDREYLDAPVANWVGMSPTNVGFQLLQEAYQDGKWLGDKPLFKLPRAFRKAGYETLSVEEATKELPAKTNLENSPKIFSETYSDPRADGPMFQLTRHPEYDSYSFSTPVNDDFISSISKTVEELRLGGNEAREKHDKETARLLRDFGLNVGINLSSDEESDYSDTEPSTSPSKQTTQNKAPATMTRTDSITLKKRKEQSDPSTLGISAKKAKLWLESM